MSDQKPSVGRIVHYRSYGTPIRDDGTQAFRAECRAAIVTEVEDGSPVGLVGLFVLNPTGLFLHNLADGGCAYFDPAEHGETMASGGSWHWPERV